MFVMRTRSKKTSGVRDFARTRQELVEERGRRNIDTSKVNAYSFVGPQVEEVFQLVPDRPRRVAIAEARGFFSDSEQRGLVHIVRGIVPFKVRGMTTAPEGLLDVKWGTCRQGQGDDSALMERRRLDSQVLRSPLRNSLRLERGSSLFGGKVPQ